MERRRTQEFRSAEFGLGIAVGYIYACKNYYDEKVRFGWQPKPTGWQPVLPGAGISRIAERGLGIGE
jgi:hypothetical protein